MSKYTNKLNLDDFFFEKSSNSVELFFKHRLSDKDIKIQKKNKASTNSTSKLNSATFLNEKNLELFLCNSRNNLELTDTAESIIRYNENLKKNKTFSEILEDKNIFYKSIYISSSYEFDFYQSFFFFFLKNGAVNKKLELNMKLLKKIYLLKQITVNFFVEFSLKSLYFLQRLNFDFRDQRRSEYSLKNFYFFYFFYFFKKNKYKNLFFFKNKINFNKLCNSIFFFNKSFIFLNSSVFYSMFNVLSNTFFSFLYKFFTKLKISDKFKKLNSTTPVYLFSNFLKKRIFFNIESKISNQFLYLNKFFLFFFENFFKSKVFFKIKFFKKIYNFIEKKLKIYNFYSKFNWAQSKIGKGFFLKEMLKVLWISFFIKDPKFLLNWISKTMNRVYFKNHKKFLIVFKSVVTRFFYLFFKDLNFKGFFFDIRGKVGVTGNAKKRHFSIKFGRFSHSRKSLRLNMFQNLVKTKTGVLGLTLVISF